MDYQQIVCSKTGKSMKADKMYKVRNDNCIENVVSVCFNCPFSNSNNSACKNCYGTIVQNAVRQINEETRRIKMKATDYRNNFLELGDAYVEMMDADEFLDNIDILANLSNSTWNSGQKISDHLRCYDSPATAKTDCAKCKKRCHDKGELTACEKAQQYVKDLGINLDTATESQIINIDLPQNCICKNQIPRMLYA